MLAAVSLTAAPKHRDDIDGLRAIAVLSTICFHFGVLPRGYFGVDIFFVISGFLITGIIYQESLDNRFSIVNFYTRRIRRILPLTLFVTTVSLVVGMFVMLPDDLENLCQSVIATNLCGNNVLQAVTTRNYWDVINDYKPLMHTWSLGVEEQYYLIYPFIFLLLKGNRARYALHVVGALAVCSLALYASEHVAYKRFYFLQYRFFELAAGGVTAMLLNGKTVRHPFAAVLLLATLIMITCSLPGLSEPAILVALVATTCGVLASANTASPFVRRILENRIFLYVGWISFSLYMWHQVVLAYARYLVGESFGLPCSAILAALILGLSVLTYHGIERPCRDKNATPLMPLLGSLIAGFAVTIVLATYVYAKAGVIRDVPELAISSATAVRNMHGAYNDRVFGHDRPFAGEGDRIKVLVIGDSFGRDWANVLLESRFGGRIELSYGYYSKLRVDERQLPDAAIRDRGKDADVIFISRGTPAELKRWGLDAGKVWVVGPKNFGVNNGIFYNKWDQTRAGERVAVDPEVLQENEVLRDLFSPRYIDLIAALDGGDCTVKVFTPAGLFISQDTRHLTRGGAVYYAQLLDHQLDSIFAEAPSKPR